MAAGQPARFTGEEAPDPDATPLLDLRLVLLGWRWPGKSLTGNTILGREEFHLERAAEFCVKRETEVAGRRVTVVDTPGWFSSQVTPVAYQQEMVRAPSMCSPGPHAFLLVIPVGMFTESDRIRTEENLAVFGDRVWHHTIVVFTLAPGQRDIPIERHIRREGRDLQRVVERCQNRYYVINNHIFGEHPQLPRLMEKVEQMVAEEGGIYEVLDNAEIVKNGKPPSIPLEQRDLGARPKQHCSALPMKTMELDNSQMTSNGEECPAGTN
ncbi:GTPase IMAP family member 4 isoform X2 [Scleropages formosus]|uniref:GTPase IMAP family member 4-like n=1 Tax=Scleropages formosus TaxID=113540 RepID=A0A8C9SLY4_SCLFO|nr:GTPase IMAP family member 4-like isoform X2 [Scleropages formosus]